MFNDAKSSSRWVTFSVSSYWQYYLHNFIKFHTPIPSWTYLVGYHRNCMSVPTEILDFYPATSWRRIHFSLQKKNSSGKLEMFYITFDFLSFERGPRATPGSESRSQCPGCLRLRQKKRRSRVGLSDELTRKFSETDQILLEINFHASLRVTQAGCQPVRHWRRV